MTNLYHIYWNVSPKSIRYLFAHGQNFVIFSYNSPIKDSYSLVCTSYEPAPLNCIFLLILIFIQDGILHSYMSHLNISVVCHVRVYHFIKHEPEVTE